MLQLTSNATAVITSIVAERDMPVGAGLRISAETGDTANPLQVTTAAVPGDADTVVENEGARVFLESNAATLLDDKVLDAVIEQGQAQFVLVSQ